MLTAYSFDEIKEVMRENDISISQLGRMIPVSRQTLYKHLSGAWKYKVCSDRMRLRITYALKDYISNLSNDKYMTVAMVSQAIGVSVTSIRVAIRSGRLKAEKRGNGYRIKRCDFEEFVANRYFEKKARPPMNLPLSAEFKMLTIDEIKAFLRKNRISMTKLAKGCGTWEPVISDILNGKRQFSPTKQYLISKYIHEFAG